MRKALFSILAATFLCISGCMRVNSPLVTIQSPSISLGFERETGKLVSFMDKTGNREFIDPASVTGLPWRLASSTEQAFSQDADHTVSFRKHGRGGVIITYKYAGEIPLEVRLDVSLEKDRPMSHWSASFSGLKGVGSGEVSWPVVSGVKAYENADLALPTWLGLLTSDPAEKATEEKPAVYSRTFPGSSLQLMLLYDRISQKSGLYLSSQDTESMVKSLTMSLTPSHVECRAACLVPDKEKTDSFSPGYDVVVGSFDGDWFAAASIYREWALNQKFCTESRFRNGQVPEWLQQTAFWVWNRGWSSNVLKEAEDMQARLGLPVNVYWHWWHGCPYDEGFPEYIPPREGKESFMAAVEHAHGQGIHSLVYMNSFQWGDTADSYEAEGAAAYAARQENGDTYRHVYEVFSGKGLIPMCMATQFWRNKYASLCDTVINIYHVDGVYMDQACSNKACYNPAHGHSLGGGNYWFDGFGKLTGQIRNKFHEGSDAMLAGEGSAEDWIPLLDDFLTLQPSQERYNGVGKNKPIPMFQAVYHDYALTYGSYSSLVYPPYDEFWPKEFRPANAETLLPEDYNMQFRMEQARSFIWGMQPTLANYHSFLFDERPLEMAYLVNLVKTRYNALDYLLKGQLKAFPELKSVEITIPISKISIYAGRTGNTVTRFEKKTETLFASAWLSPEGNAAFALTNILDEPAEVVLPVETGMLGIPKRGNVNIITADGKTPAGEYSDGSQIRYTLPARSSCVIELYNSTTH